jgi:predicted DsbA family dithiol-disulfide isomerase
MTAILADAVASRGMDRLDVYSDPICPWCFIGRQHMRAALDILAGQGMRFTVSWRPLQLNPDMPKAGLPRADYRRAKFGSLEQGHRLDDQVAAAAQAAGLRINHDRIARTPNTLAAHRLIRLAGSGEQQDAVVGRLFEDYFVDGRDIGDASVLADAAAAAGMDRASTLAALASDAGRAEVEQEDAAVRRAGLQGVPAFVVRNRLVFSGAVSADAFADGLARACAAPLAALRR